MMTNDELQDVVPDPDPIIDCDDCGEGYHFQDYWEKRYVKPNDVNEHEESWRCDECKRIKDRRDSNQSITRFIEP